MRDNNSLHNAMRGVDAVFHAAALKQVPSCEFHPIEAVQTNIPGTENVLSSALKLSVKRVLLLSTDKAAYPINAMGISKAMAEKLLLAKARENLKSQTEFCATRYGNVMASRGSVIPLFAEQLMKNVPLTITNPNMTRFLMSLDDSVLLVRYALEHGSTGDIYVKKSPATDLITLAKAMKNIFQSSSEIKIIGTRHGEKLFETLMSSEERRFSISEDEYFRIPMDVRDINYSKYFAEGNLNESEPEPYHSHNAEQLNIKEVEAIIRDLALCEENFKCLE